MKKNIISIFIVLFCFAPINGTTKQQEEINCHSLKYATDYDGSSYQETVTETINYTRKEEIEYNISAGLPKYNDSTGLSNICAVLAGTNLVGFYDRIYTNLITDFTPARIIQGKTIYTNSSPKIQEVITSLYGLMDSVSTGTTLNGFKKGLSSYISSKGNNIIYSDVGDNYSAIQTHVLGENLTALFLIESFNYVPYGNIVTSVNSDRIIKEIYNGNHVALVYGYRIISYYNGINHIATKKFLKVNTGFATAPLAYMQYDDLSVSNALNIWVE